MCAAIAIGPPQSRMFLTYLCSFKRGQRKYALTASDFRGGQPCFPLPVSQPKATRQRTPGIIHQLANENTRLKIRSSEKIAKLQHHTVPCTAIGRPLSRSKSNIIPKHPEQVAKHPNNKQDALHELFSRRQHDKANTWKKNRQVHLPHSSHVSHQHSRAPLAAPSLICKECEDYLPQPLMDKTCSLHDGLAKSSHSQARRRRVPLNSQTRGTL